jgi:hypothetical protein
MSTTPRASNSKRSLSRSYISGATWMRPGSPVDSMREAVFTASPHTS